MIRILLALVILSLIGCVSEKRTEESRVYFAGEIVNPTSNTVILYKGDSTIDSVTLDEQNRFVISLDSVEEGLHHFYHHPELQYVFLEKGDSLQIRLNTVDFDESLVFSGQGEEVNNFLLSVFLANEQQEEVVYSYYGLEPRAFGHKIDSLQDIKIRSLKELNSEGQLTEDAFEIAKAGIMYSSYIYKEAYPFYHKKKKGYSDFPELPEDFYKYRDFVDYNNQELTYLRPYYNFMKYHLGNLAYMSCQYGCDPSGLEESDQLHFNKHKLALIDSLVEQKDLRDNLFRNVAVDYLLKHDSEEYCESFIESFHKRSGNNKHIAEITSLYEGIQNMRENHFLPEVTVYDTDGAAHSIRDVSRNKRVVFYFWSGAEKGHFTNISRRVAELKVKHPQYAFIGINLRTDEARWQQMLDTYQLDKSEQFWAKDYENVARTLIVYDPNKSIIANNGVIVDAFANVYKSFK
ncbi:MAG: transaldolase [Flavobacteriaceae bacterium]|nr:transaldolase [Flavobacteriaceae bacterium]